MKFVVILISLLVLMPLIVKADTTFFDNPDDAFIAIAGVTEVSFTTAAVSWGTGYVTTGGTTCTLDTEGTTTGCTGFTPVSTPLVIENIGSTDVELELKSDKDANSFIGGTSPSFKWKMTANETGSCVGITPTIYTNVNTTDAGTQVCTTFYALDTKDALNIDLEVVIPSDATAAAKSATITATATAL